MSTLDGDEDCDQAFVALYWRHYAEVLAYARRRVDEAAARDVASDTFLVAWRRLDEAAAGGLPWLYRTAQLTLANRARTERRAARTVGRLAGLPAPPPVVDPAVAYTDREQLLDALRALSATDRELLLLVVWEQLDVRTAARVVGCSAGAAAVRMHRARRRLRALLTPPAAMFAHADLPPAPEMS